MITSFTLKNFKSYNEAEMPLATLTFFIGPNASGKSNALEAIRLLSMLSKGTRLDDLKRWKMGFTRSAPQNIALLITGPDFNLKTVAAGDDKFVWAIPANDITTNPNIATQQNPGW